MGLDEVVRIQICMVLWVGGVGLEVARGVALEEVVGVPDIHGSIVGGVGLEEVVGAPYIHGSMGGVWG